MAKVDFGIIEKLEPARDYSVIGGNYGKILEEFRCVRVDDDFSDLLFPLMGDIPVSYCRLDRRGVGLDQCGVNLVAPEYLPTIIDRFTELYDNTPSETERAELDALLTLLRECSLSDKYMICFGL